MRCRVRMRVLCVAAAVSVCDATPAAADRPLSLSSEDYLRGGATPERFLYFAGVDVWRYGGTLYGGMLWSPRGLRDDGFTMKLLYAGGFYLYRADGRSITGAHDTIAAQAGFRVIRDGFEATVYAGPDLQYHVTLPRDPGNRLRGLHAGARIGADLWWEPRANWMLAASISASTVGPSYSLRLASGWRVGHRFWAGPEFELSGDPVYRQYRLGAHLTSMQFWFGEWMLGGGFITDSDRRTGVYGRLGFVIRR